MESITLFPPDDFHPSVEVAGCYCEFEDKILLCKRAPHKNYGTTWGIPGGKLDAGETPRVAAAREVFEEVGIQIRQEELEEIDSLYIRHPHIDYIFHRFRKRFLTLPTINLSLEEHTEARWLTVEEGLQLPLIFGGKEALLTYQNCMDNQAIQVKN